ncbi:hypothetical protein [Gaetbulibacter saemankumensis]|uniref:hypothetical protein n=1 Tax=Gaetbulibacter saemankumensis TaxID=311208 RepID=UPI00040D9D33|nr:hypothetical protein [Gaetbulibacter saemankumensis]
MTKFLIALFSILTFQSFAQTMNDETLPYYEIPDYDEAYTAASVAARMIDGLGFRYYWATEGLRPEDLAYKTIESARTSDETIEHLYGLSKFIRNSILESNKDANKAELSFEDKRKKTLENLKLVSEVLRRKDNPFNLEETEIPFWNLINGPISDALWHCGQIVAFRRASGNPFTSNVSLFSGKIKNKS